MIESGATPSSWQVAGHRLAVDRARRRTGRARRAVGTCSGDSGGMARSTFTFSSRTASASKATGGSIATSASSCIMWFWTMSRIAPACVVVAGAALQPQALGHRDLHVVDVLAVPDRLEDAVGEAEDQDVLDRLLAQVVVDAVDLALAEDLRAAGGSARGPLRRSWPNGFSTTMRFQPAALSGSRVDSRRPRPAAPRLRR